MKLIKSTPGESGAYPPIQEGIFQRVPEGTAVWPEALSTEAFYACSGFVTLDVQDGVVCGCTPNAEAREAWELWKAEQLETVAPTEYEPSEADDTAALLVDHEYRLTLLELGLMGEGGDG